MIQKARWLMPTYLNAETTTWISHQRQRSETGASETTVQQQENGRKEEWNAQECETVQEDGCAQRRGKNNGNALK